MRCFTVHLELYVPLRVVFSSLGNTFPCPCWRGSVWLSIRCPCWALVSVVLHDPLRVVVICGAVSAAAVSCRWCRRWRRFPPSRTVWSVSCPLPHFGLVVRGVFSVRALVHYRKWQAVHAVGSASACAPASNPDLLRVAARRSSYTPPRVCSRRSRVPRGGICGLVSCLIALFTT